MQTAVFDAHFHVIDPSFPLTGNDGYFPPTFTVADYLARTGELGVAGADRGSRRRRWSPAVG